MASIPASAVRISDDVYTVNVERSRALRESVKPWSAERSYFRKVCVPASVAIKIMNHALMGVERGLKEDHHMPVEVGGFLMGHVDSTDERTLVVMDAFPTWAKGEPAFVDMSSEELMTYRNTVRDIIIDRHDGNFFCGWYHSHPLEVQPFSNAHLSNIDVGTQALMQNSLEVGSTHQPTVALVVDPLGGFAKGRPEIGAYRVYAGAYEAPTKQGPDGATWDDETALIMRYGTGYRKYYDIPVEYIVPSASAGLLGILSREFSWTHVLSSTPALEKEARSVIADRLERVTRKLETASTAVKTASFSRPGRGGGGGGMGFDDEDGFMGGGGGGSSRGMDMMAMLSGGAGGRSGSSSYHSEPKKSHTNADLSEAVSACSTLASEMCRCHSAQMIKRVIFGVAGAPGDGAAPVLAAGVGGAAGGGMVAEASAAASASSAAGGSASSAPLAP